SPVLENDRLAFLVRHDLGRERHLAFAFTVSSQAELDQCERIIDRARLSRRFVEADRPVGHDRDLFAAVGAPYSPRKVQIPTEARGRADEPDPRYVLQYLEELVGAPVEQDVDETITLRVG